MFQVLVAVAIFAGVAAVDFEIVNLEEGPVWIGIQGNPGYQHLANGGFRLNQGESRTIGAADNWQGRFWARTWCDENSKHCATGDCGNRLECAGAGGEPPASLAEITLKGAGGLDFYDISLVDGFNIPISFEPVGGQGDNGPYSCRKAACAKHLNDECPNELKKSIPEAVVGCKSACVAFNTDEYCCRGNHNTPETCPAPKQYADFFKSRCPDAYSYAYDDHKSTFTCRANKYKITFGF